MLIASMHSILAGMGREIATLRLTHARKRRNAMSVLHLEALPAYLRRDIGLPDDADIVDVVEHGLVRRQADTHTCRPIAIQPHAV